MSASQKPPAAGRRTAFAVLALALAATFFGVWREHQIERQNQVIRWQEALAQIQPALSPLLGHQFVTLHDQAKSALRRDNFSETGWTNFLAASEWRSRFPGLKEIGYAEFSGEKCVVKFSDADESFPPYAPGFDLNSTAVIRDAVQKSADAGFGTGSQEMLLGTNRVVIGLMAIPFRDVHPASAAAENRANLRGLIFLALDQREYFAWLRPQLAALPLDLRLLAADEAGPPRSATQRTIGHITALGEWRFAVTMKAPPASKAAPQWIVLIGGIALSLLLFWLFTTQTRLRMEAEAAGEKLLQREVEITTLNHGLEQKVAERTAQLNEALAQERELNQLKSNFISIVTHEIRTPLALILGSSEILSRYLDRLPSERRAEHLKTIDSSVQRMSALMEDVLLFSRAEAGRMEFNPVELNLKNFCARLVDELLSATNRRCPIELSASEIPGPARADEGLLRHIFSNLIANAVKYSPPETPVKFSVSRDGGDVVFIVQDCGVGIPEEDRKRLFTPFYRGKNVATIQGTGLGLVIVRRCIERHGGYIEVESAENVGTMVSVRLPLLSPAHTEFIKRLSQDKNE